jgi:hypothetical protein
MQREENGAKIWKSINNFFDLKKNEFSRKYQLLKTDVIKIGDYEISFRIQEKNVKHDF